MEQPSLDIDLAGVAWVKGREIECGVRGNLEEREREGEATEKQNACRITEVSMNYGIALVIG